MLVLVVFTVAVQLICKSSAVTDLPSYFPRCKLQDPNLNDCILKASDEVRQYMKKGIQELDIPPFEPLIIPEIKSDRGTDAVNFKLTLRNAKIGGLGDYKFKELGFDPKTLSFHGTALFKKLSLDTDFDIDGKILLAPIKGKGSLKAQFDSTSGGIAVTGELIQRNGEEYYHPLDVKAKVNIGNINTTFNSLFQDNDQLARATADLLREHSNELLKEITPAVEEVVAQLTFKIIQGINKNIPFKKLFV